jgi:hypothetical protein
MKVIGVINLIGLPMFDEWINKTSYIIIFE